MTNKLREDILDLSRQGSIGDLSPWFQNTLDHYIETGRYVDLEKIQYLQHSLVMGLSFYAMDHKISTVVLGMSGGVDSALTAALFKAAGWRVIGYTLPIKQNPAETERGIEACKALGIEHVHIDLTEQYNSMLMGLSGHNQRLEESSEEASNIRRGNIRARLRMITLYDQAHRYGGLVASTDNYSELAAGFWNAGSFLMSGKTLFDFLLRETCQCHLLIPVTHECHIIIDNSACWHEKLFASI